MNIWALLYFTAFLFYLYSGIYVLKLNRKSMINVLFFVMCISLSAWSLGYSFSTGARDIQEAMAWRRISTFGWTFFYSNLLLFIAAITKSKLSPETFKYSFGLYVPSAVFFLRFLNHDTGNYVDSPFGWVYLLYYKGLWSYAFDIFYLICVVSAFTLLFIWKYKTDSLRERKQVQIIIVSMLGAFLGGGLTDTLLPIVGVKVLPLGILFSAIAIMGMWVAITKYKMMNLTQEIAAEHVLVTMKDPVIVLDPQYRIGQVNKATLEITGFQHQELVGEGLKNIIPKFEKNHIIFNELERQGHTNGYEIQMQSISGELIPCLCSGVYVMSDFGEKIGLILVLHDITNRKVREELLNRANEDLQMKITKINNVFDNVREGILTFGEDLMIHNEYSFECQRLFNGPIDNRAFYQVIYPDDVEMQNFTKALLRRIFESDAQMRELYIPLLPEQVMVFGSNVSLQFKFTSDANKKAMMMAIISDNTEKVKLENERDVERKTLKMVVKAILGREDFLELIEEYRRFVNEEFNLVASDVSQFLTRLHTFKGNFGQFDMLHLVDHLHELETWLAARSKNQSFQLSGSELVGWLQEDLDIIEGIVGREYFDNSSRITVEPSQLDDLKNEIMKYVAPNQAQILIDQLNSLYNKTVHELIGSYPEYTVRLGERWGKKIQPFSITGDIVFVNPQSYQQVFKNLVHIFRNAVAHGIESEDERIERGKTPEGHIVCEIKELQEFFVIFISDDGKGIDPLDVAAAALKLGLITQDVVSEMEEQELLSLIFAEYLTTNDEANSISGRGVGLTALKHAVDQVGGRLKVTSGVGKGVQFDILLPKKNEVRP